METKPVKGDKLWRGLALLVLCALVYYFSYDHGRQEVLPRLEAARSELRIQQQHILHLRNQLEECQGLRQLPTQEAITLKTKQSRFLFGQRLVLTLLDVTEDGARIQLNFIEAGELLTKTLAAGASFNFRLDQKEWALVAANLTFSTANFNLIMIN